MGHVKSSDLGNPLVEMVDKEFAITTNNIIPNNRQVSKRDITKVVNKIKKHRKEQGK
jgi:hypothetical protein